MPEGQALARQQSEAGLDYEPEEIITKVEAVGGGQAEANAKKLELSVQEFALLHNIGTEAAYDRILATPEGMGLRQRYDGLVRG